jgi:hypothetical protein
LHRPAAALDVGCARIANYAALAASVNDSVGILNEVLRITAPDVLHKVAVRGQVQRLEMR